MSDRETTMSPDEKELFRAEARAQKLAAAGEIFGVSEEVLALLSERAVAALPRRALERYTLPRLAATACNRVGDNLVRIEIEGGRQFYGHRSERVDYLLHHMLRRRVPKLIDGDAYKLVLDIHFRYLEGTFRWYFGTGPGVYIEGGCFTGLKAMKWHDHLGPESKVIAVEVEKSNYDLLEMNVAANGLGESIIPVHAGLWRETGEGTQKHSFTTRRFLESTDRWESDLVHDESVRLLTVDDLLDEQGVEVAEYLNVQVNGAEIQVLEGFTDVDRVKVIDVAAYYSKDGIRNVDVLRQMMCSRGCQVVTENAAGRIAFATPAHVDQVLAQNPGHRRA